jgi:hypothetical protein
MAQDLDLHKLSLNYLGHRCARETDHFFHRRKHDPSFCFELYRRAAMNRDEAAWEYIFRQYQPLVAGWVERHSLFPTCNEETEFFVNRAFEKLWAVLTPEKFSRFPDLKAVLRYLQMCVHSVIVDYLRASEQASLLEDEPGAGEWIADPQQSSLEADALRRVQASAFWELLSGKLKSEKERRAIYGSFVLALKPAELVQHYPGVFQDVKEVYLVKENVLDRLRRDAELLDFLGDSPPEMPENR